MPVLIIRHGPTAWNAAHNERIRGHLDVPLSPEGITIAEQTARALKDYPIREIYSSDLQRAAVTAACLARETGCLMTLHRELRPWNLGTIQGTSVVVATPQINDLVANPMRPAPQGESFFAFLRTFLPFIMPLVRQDDLIAVVSHIRDLKALEAHIAAHGYGIDKAVWSRPPTIEPGGAALVTPTSFEVCYQPEMSHV